MTHYIIRKQDKIDAQDLITKIRKLIKTRNLMQAGHLLTKLNDIFMNIKEVEPNGSAQ